MVLEIFAVNVAGKVRRASLHGRDHLVAPVTMIVPGVLRGSKGPLFYPPEEIAASVNAWNHMPLTVYHPFRANASARDPDILNSQGIGVLLNTKIDKQGRLKGEAWFDIDRTRALDDRIINSLEDGSKIELSTGLFTDMIPAEEGATFNGREYDYVARNYRPDHLAILPDQIGACSISDGCGVLVNSSQRELEVVWNTQQVNNEMSLDDIYTAVCDALCEAYPPKPKPGGMMSMSPYVMAVFDSYFVFKDEDELYRQGYTIKDGKAVLKGEPQQVRKNVEYVPVTENSNGGGSMLNPNERSTLIGQITTNCECYKGAEALLNQMDDSRLSAVAHQTNLDAQARKVANAAVRGGVDEATNKAFRLNPETATWEFGQVTNTQGKPNTPAPAPTPAPVVTTPAPTENTTPAAPAKPKTQEEWLKLAPEGVRNQWESAQRVLQERKDGVIKQLLVNVSPADRSTHWDRLQLRSLEDLEYDLSLIPKAPVREEKPTQNTNPFAAFAQEQLEQEDTLEMMTINWGAEPENKAPLTGNAAPNAPRVPSPANSMSEEEWLRFAPPAVRQKVANANHLEQQEKENLVNILTAHIQNEEEEQQAKANYRNMPIANLRVMAQYAPKPTRRGNPDYFGSAGAPPAPRSVINAVDDEEPLVAPTLDFSSAKTA